MSKPENEDSKLKFKAALEKKNNLPKEQIVGNGRDGVRNVQESSGKIRKMFRRKSG